MIEQQQANLDLSVMAEEKPLIGGYMESEIENRTGYFIITAIQNNTAEHAEAWQAIKNYAERNDAQIICCPILYNKNAWAQPDDAEGVHFESVFKPYMVENRVLLNDNVLLIGNAHVLPTAKNPLSGFDAAGLPGQTIIIPASKLALECKPALKGEKPITLLSTGTATLRNYIQRKAGVVSELEHSFGAVIVEPGKLPRSVSVENGGFYDFDGKEVNFYGEGCKGFDNVVITLGDIHAEKCPADRLNSLHNFVKTVSGSFFETNIIIHDLLDFSSRNHHNRENHFFRLEHDMAGGSVANDVKMAKKALQTIGEGLNVRFNIVESNHDLALDRWLNEADYREDTINAETYLTLALQKVKAIRRGLSFNPFAFLMKSCKADATFNPTDNSLQFHGVEFGNHGDKGPNGARGSIQAFRKLGRKMVIGHSHTPGIAGNVYQVGVSGSLDMGYNQGPSSWRHAHCITYPNGQNQIIFE